VQPIGLVQRMIPRDIVQWFPRLAQHVNPGIVFGIVSLALVGIAAPGPATCQPPAESAGTGDSKPEESTNRLIESNDPYLLLHAHNPVDWYPWGPEALAKAKREDKPIFLSVGYSTCFWCHVAERTIYSNPDIAKLMNKWFVNIKVDNEQRPDVDRIYMLARQIITGSGGWPNNVFLTPDLKPFYAGSYFPPKDDPRRGFGFPTVLKLVHELWQSDREGALRVADNVMDAMRRVQSYTSSGTNSKIDPAAWLASARATILAAVDDKHGGLANPGSGTKFPQAPSLDLLLTDYRASGSEESLAAVLGALDAMAFGGIRDQLGGGFHRYSTEPTWSVPHFEKMLYDNAQLLRLYADAFAITKNPLYRYIGRDTAEYIAHDMLAPDGGFYTARDAQVDGVEGGAYLWTPGQITQLLGDAQAEHFLKVYKLTPLPRPDIPGLRHPALVDGEEPGVLRVRVPLADTLKSAVAQDVVQMLSDLSADRAKLLEVRAERRQPARDDKLIVALNGLTIAALAKSGKIFGEPQYIEWAAKAAERIWTVAFNPKTRALKHEIFRDQAQTEAFLQDYAQLGLGYWTLAEVTGDDIWLERAAAIADSMFNRFVGIDGSLKVTTYEEDLPLVFGDEGDTVEPSGTSAAIDLLLRLSVRPGDARYQEASARVLRRVSGLFAEHPGAWAAAVAAVNRNPPNHVAAAVATSGAAGSANPPEAVHIEVTADHVKATGVAETSDDGDKATVRLEIDKGYHVNANPASFDYLIPTILEFRGAKPTKITYPKPVRFTPAFATDGLDVYEGTVTISAIFPEGSLAKLDKVQTNLTAQVCTDQICLPPSKITITLEGAAP